MNTRYIKPKSILVIEDDTALNEIFCLALELEGYQVKGLANGQEALTYLLGLGTNEYPQCILLDLMMPIMDGNTFLGKINELPGLCQLPVIICSAYGEFQKTQQVICNLEKPVSLDKLYETFNQYIKFEEILENGA